MGLFFCALGTAFVVLARLSDATSDLVLSQVSPLDEEQVCPGQDVTYKCTLHGHFNLFWFERVPGESSVAVGATQNAHTNFTVGHFLVQIISQTFGSSSSIVSTATLQEAQFSHNNIIIECHTISMTGNANDTITVSVLGASSHPYNLTLSPQNASIVFLSWLPPNGSNCSFSYAVSSNGSSVTHYRTSKPSLKITDLNITTFYQFAVAAEDTDFTTGPWSEMIGILWNVPQVVLNITSILKVDVLEGKWTLHQIDDMSPPTLRYNISHNITSSGDTVSLTVHRTAITISLDGVPPGHYYIAVAAVNIIGEGDKYNHFVTVTMPVATIASTQHLISSEGSYVPDSKQLLLTSLFSQTSSMQSTNNEICNSDMFQRCSHCFSTTPVVGQMNEQYSVSVGVITAVLVSGILFGAITTIISAAVIVWCVVRKREQMKNVNDISLQAAEDAGKNQAIELTPVEYEDPFLRECKNPTIHVKDNVAYGEIKDQTIHVQDNVAYGGKITS